MSDRRTASDVDVLARMLATSSRAVALTGAGCSTECGIPDYRDAAGQWKRRPPVLLAEFVRDERARRRYWARSMVGWERLRRARPGLAHRTLASLEREGRVHHVITQNVDGLHRAAGTRGLTELHGNLDSARCLRCGSRVHRDRVQAWLRRLNRDWSWADAALAPDGDVDLGGADYDAFQVPGCPSCGGVLKPEVVFFGENVPAPRVQRAFARLAEADLLLVVGSSLMVFSGYRFVREARRLGLPVAIINMGRTRGDGDAALKVEAPCGEVLETVRARLSREDRGDPPSPGEGFDHPNPG